MSASDVPTAVDLLSWPLHPAGVVDLGHAGLPVGADGTAADVARRPLVVPELVLDPEWLADLDDPTLIISPGYVGPDRRGSARDEDGTVRGRRRRVGFVRRGTQVALMTALAVVSLALIASRSAPPAAHAPSAPNAAVAAAPTGRTGAGHASRSASRQMARAEAAAQRSLGRHPAATGVAASSPSGARHSAVAVDAAAVSRTRASARQLNAVARAAVRADAMRRRAAAAMTRTERQGDRHRAGSRTRSASTTSTGGEVSGADHAGRIAPGTSTFA